jgi:hypothetical protein
MALRLTRVVLTEGVPAVCFLGLVGVVVNQETLQWLALAPLLGWLVASAQTAKLYLEEAREDGASPLVAVLRGVVAPIEWMVASYWRLGLYRVRWLYDAAAVLGMLAGVAWWIARYEDQALAATLRYLCAFPLAGGAVGLWRRMRSRRETPQLFLDVLFTLDSWQHRRRRVDEMAYEGAIAGHLQQHGFDVLRGARLDSGREADIVVRPKGRAGRWDYRDVMVEMKAHLLKTNERDRALGQLETYAAEWPGAIVLMICGAYRDELLEPLRQKATALQEQGRPVRLIVKGREA